MKKPLLITCIALFASILTYSQINFQVYGSYVRNLNKDFGGNTFGCGLRFEFGGLESPLSYYIGVGYASPITTKKIITAQAYNNFTNPSSVDVTATYKLPMYRAEGGMRYYLTNVAHNYEGINVYLNGGAEIIYISNKPQYSDYDKELYTLGYSEESDVNEDGTQKSVLNIMGDFGVGIEKNMGPGNIFFHTQIAFPVTRTGNTDISSQIAEFTPIALGINIGYKINIGPRIKE